MTNKHECECEEEPLQLLFIYIYVAFNHSIHIINTRVMGKIRIKIWVLVLDLCKFSLRHELLLFVSKFSLKYRPKS